MNLLKQSACLNWHVVTSFRHFCTGRFRRLEYHWQKLSYVFKLVDVLQFGVADEFDKVAALVYAPSRHEESHQCRSDLPLSFLQALLPRVIFISRALLRGKPKTPIDVYFRSVNFGVQMRLLNTSTLALYEFFGNAIPHYAILSHRWGTEEVSLQDLRDGKCSGMKGFSKIKKLCERAAADGWHYAWMDSCCIDKTSSAELSEAINSMFQWYKQSTVCYVYLSDVASDPNFPWSGSIQASFRKSSWWGRGWTLQELIAPERVIFYDKKWMEIGTKTSLETVISAITGISRPHLRDHTTASVAQIMSWASRRETTRVEDIAYSLMGLFHVNMPPLYGEGTRAFQRLQLEILASSDDESLFAWERKGLVDQRNLGLLADSPLDFSGSRGVYRIQPDASHHRPPFTMTNKGLRIEVDLLPSASKGEYLAPLNCANGINRQLAIVLSPEGDIKEEIRHTSEVICKRTSTLTTISDSDGKGCRLNAIKTVILVKQPPYNQGKGIVLTDRHNIEFVLKTGSLLENNFTVIRGRVEPAEIEPERRLKDKNILQGSKTYEFQLATTLQKGVWFTFADRSSRGPLELSGVTEAPSNDIFYVYILWHLSRASVKIIFPLELSRALSIESNADRVSRKLPSGRSISAALRVEAGKRLNMVVQVLDVIIDPEGKLPWPELGY